MKHFYLFILTYFYFFQCEKVEYPEYEKTVDVRHDFKAIRLDIYIKGKNEIYNIEIQNSNIDYLPKRGRYYQDLLDLDSLEKGQA